jgi:hypothetical protein
MLPIGNTELDEIRKRAAKIRGNWSVSERRRRMGLPPDMPQRLRDYVFAPRVAAWMFSSAPDPR